MRVASKDLRRALHIMRVLKNGGFIYDKGGLAHTLGMRMPRRVTAIVYTKNYKLSAQLKLDQYSAIMYRYPEITRRNKEQPYMDKDHFYVWENKQILQELLTK